MEIFLIVLLILSLCLCGIVCTRLYEANKFLEKLSAAYGVSQKLVQAQNELIENQKKYIVILGGVIENEEKEVK
jgi:thioredoxin-related protein